MATSGQKKRRKAKGSFAKNEQEKLRDLLRERRAKMRGRRPGAGQARPQRAGQARPQRAGQSWVTRPRIAPAAKRRTPGSGRPIAPKRRTGAAKADTGGRRGKAAGKRRAG